MTEPISLFKKQRTIYPRRVWGRYRKVKWVAMVTLLAIYYLTPWIRWDRGPNAPDQAILIDMGSRRGYFFGIEIWPQEVYYLTGILILAAVGLFFVTSLFGRVWCGYACPQTVWTDLFVWVERIVQGDRNARMKLSEGPLTFQKIWKKGLTHIIWIIIGVCTGGAWVFYFNDAPTLAQDILHGHIPNAVGGWIIALTASTYLMAGYAREQVCTYMCPYARFQSAMFDKDTLIITYDEQRGEPRGKHKAGDSWEGKGHCIDCDSCVVVCPTGIDIRKGLQLECIACGLCVDACNNVMEKIGLPKGLIRYDTENNMLSRKDNPKQVDKLPLLRARSIYYAVILSVVGTLMLYGLLTRSTLELHVIHARNPLFVQLSNGDVRNNFTIKILNKSHDDHAYELTVTGMDNPEIKVEGAGDQTANHLFVLADSVGEFRILLSGHKSPAGGRADISFVVREIETGKIASHDTIFISEK